MKPAEKLLGHFDRLAGSTPRFVQVSQSDAHPAIYVAIYQGFPDPDATTGFTVGLSHFLPPGGAHRELTISMRDSDEAWALACGFLAFQLRNCCPFIWGHTINFREQIAKSSLMSAFVVIRPCHFASVDAQIDLGARQVELVQLLPLYETEREWLVAGGDLKPVLNAVSSAQWMNPARDSFVPKR